MFGIQALSRGLARSLTQIPRAQIARTRVEAVYWNQMYLDNEIGKQK